MEEWQKRLFIATLNYLVSYEIICTFLKYYKTVKI